MIVKIDKSFQKDVRKLNHSTLNQKIAIIIQEIKTASSISEIKNLKNSALHKTLLELELVIIA